MFSWRMILKILINHASHLPNKTFQSSHRRKLLLVAMPFKQWNHIDRQILRLLLREVNLRVSLESRAVVYIPSILITVRLLFKRRLHQHNQTMIL